MCDICNGTGERVYRDENGRACVAVCTDCDTWRNARKANLYKYANLPVKENYELNADVYRYVEDFRTLCSTRKNWLLISGRPGTGKTTQATLLGRELIDRYLRRVKFFNAFDFFRQLASAKCKSQNYESIMDKFLDVDIAILDDLLKIVPAENSFEYEDFKSVVLEALWGRYDGGKPLIITTQASSSNFVAFDAAFASRLAEKCSKEQMIKFTEDSKNWRIIA